MKYDMPDKSTSGPIGVTVTLPEASVALGEQPSGPEDGRPLLGTLAMSMLERCRADIAVSAHAAHDMIVVWLCPGPIKSLELEAQHAHCFIRWNVLYWVCYLPLIPCVLSGKWLHSLWGQGEAMRNDETMDEARVRLHWIYCLDGPIVAAALVDLIDVLCDIPNYTQRKFTSLLSWCMTVAVTGAYVLANSYFLDVMRRRSLVGVRLVVTYQTVFGVGLLNMLVAGAVRNKERRRHGDDVFATWPEFIAWSTRFTMAAFMCAAAFVYSRLWNAYLPTSRTAVDVAFTKHGEYLQRECVQYAVLPLAAILMWTLLVVAAWLDDDVFWDALV